MMKFLRLMISVCICPFLVAQNTEEPDPPAQPDPIKEPRIVNVSMEFEDASFFIESPASSIIRLPRSVEYPVVEFVEPGPFRLLDYSLIPATGNARPSVRIRWYPVKEGLSTFPSVQVSTDSAIYRTAPNQVLIRSAVRSEEISLEFRPAKSRVYVGEPLRVDVVWKSNVSTKRIRALECYPSFFNNPELEIAIPRSTDPESSQLGIPFGGRRIIARRDTDPGNPQALGTVVFPIYIKFGKPGTTILEKVRLQCAQLHQEGGPLAPYAAYYNNGLFETVDKGNAYDKIYTESPPVKIDVIPLPEEGRTEAFSGLFMPCSITSKITPAEASVGQLMDLDIVIQSPVTNEFLALPSLARQNGLRSWFKTDPEYTRTWLPDGSNFNARIRALTTKAKAIPSLKFQVFDPAQGRFLTIETEPIPITIHQQDGKDYFDSKILLDTTSNLVSREEGIWNNGEPTKMHDLLDTILGATSSYFWILMALGPVAFLTALPRVLEYRRRELDPVYRKQTDAYRMFRKLPEGDIRKWHALKRLMAVSMGAEPGSWTIGDSMAKLPDAGVDDETVRHICSYHQIVDAGDYSVNNSQINLPPIRKVGHEVFKVLRKISLIVLFAVLLTPVDSDAQDWDSSESAFEFAMQQEPGSNEYFSAFAQAALQFEAVAVSGKRPGLAWYNAGNAWFFAGEIGRSIACYKHAISHRPFDPLIKQNLTAARALSVDVIEAKDKPAWLSWPVRWVGFILILVSFIFWGMLLAYLRYRSRPLLSLTGATLILVLLTGMLVLYATAWRSQPGVVIVQEVFGRKGPGYNYLTAFNEPLHDGLEFEVIESRNEWLKIALGDGRNCWIPRTQAQLIDLSL